MNKLISAILITILLYGCAAYKELKPKPEINPVENGFIQIKKEDKYFKLKKDKKYYMVFPPAMQSNFYLVLDLENKDLIKSYLTETFDQGKGRIIEIPDQSPEPDHLSVFPISDDVPQYFWVIDLVKQDVVLKMEYRYVSRWRFSFERKYDSFKQTLTENSVDRSPYESLGTTVLPEDLDLEKEIRQIKEKNNRLAGMKSELGKIEEIFPVNIRNTTDEAYQNYLQLKSDLEDELAFQKKYLQVLDLLKKERQSRGDMEQFFTAIPDFLAFFNAKDQFPTNVVLSIRDVLKIRLKKVAPYYENKFSQKNDANRIESFIPQLEELYPAAGLSISEDFKRLGAFVHAYNKTVDEIWAAKKRLQDITDKVNKRNRMPANTFFSEIVTQLSKLQYTMPKVERPALKPYKSYRCVQLLSSEIGRLKAKINALLKKYRRADTLIPKINMLKDQNNIRGILSLLKKNKELDFLYPMYQSLDQKSLKTQAQKVRQALKTGNWAAAEQALKTLYNDRNFINYGSIKPQKDKLVGALQDSLISNIVNQSEQQAKKFINENLNTLENVEELYRNPAFLPVYEPTFFAGNQAKQRIKSLYAELEQLKTLTFPQKAIKLLYGQLISNPDDRGVLKARAIVAHGKHYRGNDSTIKNRVAECDPNIPKLLTRPKEYRRIFALPVSTNPDGENEYLFKVNLKIPSPAQYPVYDVYIRLPKEIAQQAGAKQWYKNINFNGETIKNEGRYTITAPGPENNYECQVGPLQIVKTSNNIMEVRFNKSAFKVYQISVMAQKPIIKKH